MKLSDIAKKIVSQKTLSTSDWPDYIYFESETQKRFNEIKSFSMKSRNYLFVNEGGTTAYEYAVTIVFVIDEMYYSKPIRGTYKSVTPLPRISITPLQNNRNVSFDITIGESSKSSKQYDVEKVRDNIDWGIVMSAHTHPRMYIDKNNYYHSWFSMQDFSFLLGGPVPMVTLITDNSVWVACRGATSSFPNAQLVQHMTLLDRDKKYDEMKQYAKQISTAHSIIFYTGTISGRLNKI